jgi:hypothetical protein
MELVMSVTCVVLNVVVSFEGQSMSLESFFVNVTAGRWDDGEINKKIVFNFAWAADDKISFDYIQVVCLEPGSQTVVDPYCKEGKVFFSYLPGLGRYGSTTQWVTLVDDGGTVLDGNDTPFSRFINITVKPVNDVPQFPLEESEIC